MMYKQEKAHLRSGSFGGVTRGQSLIELLIALGVTALFLPALLTGLVASREGKAQENQRIEATNLLREALEAVRSVREKAGQDKTWATTFAVNGTYHPVPSGSGWALASGADSVNGFIRSIAISDLSRDTSGAIVTSGGTPDPSAKKIVTTISWTSPSSSSVTNTSYFTRYLDNLAAIHTTQVDFDAGIKTGTATTNTSGGEVVLGAGGNADWCLPQNSIKNTLTLPKQGNSLWAKEGNSFIGTGDGIQGVTFVNVGITNPPPPAPPTASITGTYESAYKTNAVFSDGTYAYLASDGSASQVNILDISHSPYARVGWIDVPGGLPANGVSVSGNIAYVTSGRKLYTFDISTKTGAHSTALTSASVWIGFNDPLAKQVVVNGNYAFVGTANTLFGLQKFKIGSGGTSLKLVGVSNLTWQQAAQGLAVNSTGTRAYVAFNQGSFFAKGFFIVDTSPADPPTWWPFPNFYRIPGYFNTGSMDPLGMAVATSNRAIIVGTGSSQQYQVINITAESSPVLCGGLNIAQGVSGVASVLEQDGDAYSYIITGEANDQFKIIQGGAGGGQYASSGTFESATLDTSSQTAFNHLGATVALPLNTALSLQVAAAAPVSGSCAAATFAYVGPNATPSAFFVPQGNTISGVIPFGTSGNYQNPARCFRYKAYLSTTDQNATPVLYDVTVNYSP